jgi:peptidoglycan/LPS O-acetylase OafA/YrhL
MNNRTIRYLFTDIQTIPPILQTNHFPTLDGLRAVAILMVIFHHLTYSSGDAYTTFFNGPLGVLIFFVLSGFLITTLCIKEKVTTGDISLKKFYTRRALRIFPVAYLYLVVLIILNIVFKLDVPYICIAGAALYVMDISSIFRKIYYSYLPGHYWSLSVEEQFYLIVPFFLKRKFRQYLLLIFLIVFTLPLLIYLQYLFPILNGPIPYAITHVLIKFQAIGTGCLFSVLTFKYDLDLNLRTWVRGLINFSLLALILFIKYNDVFNLRNMFVGVLSSFLIGCFIVINIKPGKDLVFKILNLKIVTTIGVLSYSIYIWQQIFTSRDKNLPFWIASEPYNLIWIAVVSCASYFLYERYFLKLKARFSIVKGTSASIKRTPVTEIAEN